MSSEPTNPDHFFQCTQCGECCRGYGGTYVTEADIAAIADYLNLTVAEVKQRYCVLSGGKPIVAQRPDGFCVFFGRNCTIHPVKPLMCRRWPFIPSLLVDITNWQVMAANCPGINPQVDAEALRHYVKAFLETTKPPLP